MAETKPCCPPPALRRLLLRMPPPENVATGVMAAQKSGPVAVAGALTEWGQTATCRPVFRLSLHVLMCLHLPWRRCFVRHTERACCPCVVYALPCVERSFHPCPVQSFRTSPTMWRCKASWPSQLSSGSLCRCGPAHCVAVRPADTSCCCVACRRPFLCMRCC